MLTKNLKDKSAFIIFIIFIIFSIILSIVVDLKGHFVIKEGVVVNYRVGIMDRIKGEIDITIPEGVTAIGDYAFANNKIINTIVIPYGVEEIGKFSFMNCSNLKEISIPHSVEYMKEGIFYKCTNL